MAFLKTEDNVLAIMQKKQTKYPCFMKISLLGYLVNLSQNAHKIKKIMKTILGAIVCFMLVACAYQDEKRIDLKNLDLAKYEVTEKTELMKAAELGDSRKLKQALEQGGQINAFANQETAFSLALKSGHEAISRILLSAGSDWALGFSEQKTSALIVAADQGFDEIVKMLIVKAAPLEEKNENGYTALAKCAKNGHLTTLKILINAGANVNVQPEGRSALMHVVEKNNMLLSQLLIAAGADLNFTDADGDTALKIARRNGFFDLDLMLVQAGARP